VAKPELGTKRQCAGCGAKFYDLLKNPIVCPKCSTVFPPPAGTVARTRRVVEEVPHEVIAKAPASEPESNESDGVGDDVEIENENNEGANDAILIEPDEEDGDISDMLGGTESKDD
jgi:uncharacterized protein (TIGR02300 family)